MSGSAVTLRDMFMMFTAAWGPQGYGGAVLVGGMLACARFARLPSPSPTLRRLIPLLFRTPVFLLACVRVDAPSFPPFLSTSSLAIKPLLAHFFFLISYVLMPVLVDYAVCFIVFFSWIDVCAVNNSKSYALFCVLG